MLVGFTVWVDVADEVEDAVYAVVGFFGVLAIVFALVNCAKEKFGMALLGLLVVPFVAGRRASAREARTRPGRGCSTAATRRGAGAERASGAAGCEPHATASPASGQSAAG